MKDFLQKGDVFELKKGMTIYTKIPKKFIFDNTPFSNDIKHKCIKIGPLLECNNTKIALADIVKKSAKSINDTIKFYFGVEPSHSAALKFISEFIDEHRGNVMDNFNTLKLCGDYVVVNTAFDGGSREDGYLNGYHVWAKKLKNSRWDPDGTEIDFYQSGCFTAMNPPEKIEIKDKLYQTFIKFA